MSPGSNVIVRLMNATRGATPKIIRPVDESCRTSPLTRHLIPSACGSGISSVVTSQGPHGRNVSTALPSIHCDERNCRSRADTSFTQV